MSSSLWTAHKGSRKHRERTGEMSELKPGDKVRIRANPSRVGTLTDEYDGPPNRRRVLVRFNNGDEEFVLMGSLEKVTGETMRPFALLQSGRYGRVRDLRGAVTYYRLSGRLANLIYSLNTTNTQFLAYQFKPVLQFLDSPCNGILIADEVGLGKTIEAGLIWTELCARIDAKRLLVVCPAMLREKWQDELLNRFGIKAEIGDAETVYQSVKKLFRGEVQEVALIASIQGLRPPRGAAAERRTNGPTGKLAAILEEKAFDEPIFDMIIVDEAHYLRNQETQTHKLGRLLRPVCESLVLLSATPIQMKSDDLFSLLNLLDEDAFPYPHSFNETLQANVPIVELRDKLLREPLSRKEFVSGIAKSISSRIFKDSEQLQHLADNPPTEEELASYQGRSLLAEKLDRVNPLTKVIARTRKRDVQEMRVVRTAALIRAEMSPAELDFYGKVTSAVRSFCLDEDISTGFLLTIPQTQMASCMAAACRSWLHRAGKKGAAASEFSETAYEAFGNGSGEEDNGETKHLGTLLSLLVDVTRENSNYEELRRGDSKYGELLKALKEYWRENPGKKVVLFSFFRGTLHYLHERLAEDGVPAVLVMGGMDKQEAIRKFAHPAGADLLLSSEVAAEGVDLQFSSLLINYDLPWNPMRIEQRIGRIDRIGQEAERILIWNFLYAGSIDERIYDRLLLRLNIFEQALGSMEAILGEAIRELGYDLLVHKLSEEEKNARIDQTALAIETLNRTQETLEKEAAHLIAHGEYIQNKVKAARELGRYITGADLSSYVRDYFTQEYEGTRFIRKGDDEQYEVELSVDAKLSLGAFVESNRLAGKTRILQEHTPVILFRNNVGEKNYHAEIVSQYHPLVRFVSEELRAKGKAGGYHPVSAIEVQQGAVPGIEPGAYVYAITRWSVSGARDTERLEYSVTPLDSLMVLDEVQAERLVNVAAMRGADWIKAQGVLDHEKVASLYDDCLKDLECRYENYKNDIQRENNDRIILMINTLERHRQAQGRKIEERIFEHVASKNIKRKNLIKAEEGKLKKLNRKIDEKIAMLNSKQKIQSSEGVVSGGVILVC